MIGQAMSQLKQLDKPHFRVKPPHVVKDLEGTLQTLVREFKSSDISIRLGGDTHALLGKTSQLGKKSQLKSPSTQSQLASPSFVLSMDHLTCTSTLLHLKQHPSRTTHGYLNSPPAVGVSMQ